MASKNDNYESLLNCKSILLAGRLSLSLEKLHKYISERPYLKVFRDRLEELSDNYDRMMHYLLKGSDDPRRKEYSKSYQEEAYRLIQDVFMAEYLTGNEELSSLYNPTGAPSKQAIIEELQNINNEKTRISSTPSGTQSEELSEKFQNFEQVSVDFRKVLFIYALFSFQWDDEKEDQFVKDIFAYDEVTAQLVISAIMLGNLMVFDFRKLRSLFRIYREASSCNLRERAFVGAMFSLDSREDFWAEEQKELVLKYCSRKEDVLNVLDFQKQIVYLLDTEKDAKKAREAFDLSDIVDRNPKLKELSMSKESKFDSIDEFISPEEEEEIFERLEESMKRYFEMEKSGSDLYFKEFCMMKDFEFFHSIDAWFTPFYAENPVLHPLIEFMDGNCEFVKNLEEGVPFCSSDTYSFALTLSRMSKQIPFIKNMIRPGMFKPHEKIEDETLAASLYRRKYLQDVYRFFMLAPLRGYFFPLFDDRSRRRVSFLGNLFFDTRQYEEAHLSMCRFLARRKDYDRMKDFLFQNMPHTKDYRLIKVAYELYYCRPSEAEIQLLGPILSEDPDCRPALKLLAKCYYMMERHKEAIATYRNLLRLYPGNVGLERRIAVCQIRLGEYGSALETLFRLDYLYPNDKETIRALIEALFKNGSAEKSLHYLNKILPKDIALSKESKDDIFNAAICQWVTGNNVEAMHNFAKFLTLESVYVLNEKIQENESVLMQHYHMGKEDCLLMIDAASLYKQRMLPQQLPTDKSPKDTKQERR